MNEIHVPARPVVIREISKIVRERKDERAVRKPRKDRKKDASTTKSRNSHLDEFV